MAPGTQVVLSGLLTFGVPLVLALRELRELRRRPRGGWEPPAHEPVPVPPRPLPDCLIPKPLPHAIRRIRELEDA